MKSKAIKSNVFKTAGAFVAVAMVASIMGTTGITANANIASGLDPEKEWTSEYNSWAEVINAGAAHNEKLAAEGFTLLKNIDDMLPLTASEEVHPRVTLLGANSDTLSTGGAGSGAQDRPGGGQVSTVSQSASQLFAGMEEAGIQINPAMRAAYATNTLAPNRFSTGNWMNPYVYAEAHHYMNEVEEATEGSVEFDGKHYVTADDSDFVGLNVTVAGQEDPVAAESMNAQYNDAAIVVITRDGSEGADNAARAVNGHSDATDHYLQFTDGERELMAYAKKNFDKVIVIVNSPAVMELGALKNDDAFKAILWIGQPGWNGADVVGDILTGAINPSAHTSDVYMKDLKQDPTWYNFGNYQQITTQGTVSNDGMPMGHAGTATGDENMVDYAEGIYMGYRYYETVAAELGEAGNAWYNNAVVYPFGHGLSYTTFTQEITEVRGDLTEANKDGNVEIDVKVTNTGSRAGKEVVQIYSTAPYTSGGIEKAAKVLVGFAKTPELEGGADTTVTVTVKVKDLASFDYNDANENQHNGYELESGTYTLTAGKNSHEAYDTRTIEAAATINWDEDADENTPNNIYSQTEGKWKEFNTLSNTWTENHENHYLSRADLVRRGELDWEGIVEKINWATDSQNNRFTDEAFYIMNGRHAGHPYEDHDDIKTAEVETNYVNLWTKTEDDIPENWTQLAERGTNNATAAIQLVEMTGLAYNDAKWDEFLNQLTWREMVNVISNGNFRIPELPAVGLPRMSDQDGPGQLDGGWAWVCAAVIGNTWNVELAEEQGNIVGEESMWQNVNGWYGPAMNTHRNPLAGRNFEYYSQDGIHGGKIAAAVIKGATDKGCHVYIKHFFMNDQETGREGIMTFATEQAIREIYAKQFEIAVREGNANGVMNSFNLIGISTSVNYAVIQQMLYNEWGFDGFSVTDYWVADYAYNCGWNGYAMARGFTAPLAGMGSNISGQYAIEGEWDAAAREGKGMVTAPNGPNAQAEGYNANAATPTQWYYVRETVHRLMYTVANGNGLLRVGFTAGDLVPEAIRVNVNEAVTNVSVLAEGADLTQFDATVTSVTNLPEGLTFNAETNTISGTVAQKGVYNARVTINGGVRGTINATLPIMVGPLVEVDNTTLTTYTRYAAQVSQSAVTLVEEGEGQNYFPGQRASAATYNGGNGYLAVSYSSEDLPEGLRLDEETGKIIGVLTDTEETSITFTVAVSLTRVTRSSSWWGTTYGTATDTYDWEITLNVAQGDPNGPIGIVELYINDDGELVVSYTDGTTAILGTVVGEEGAQGPAGDRGPAGADGADGAAGADGANGADGAQGVGVQSATINENGELILTLTNGQTLNAGKVVPEVQGGCGGSVAGTVAITAGVAVALAAAAFIVIKKRKSADK